MVAVNQPSVICCLRFLAVCENGPMNQPSVICCLRFIAVCENGGGKSAKRYLLLKVYSSFVKMDR